MSETDWASILALAANNMNVSQTAVALYMHRNTLVYHIQKVKRKTGLDPLNFYDLVELVRMAKCRRAEDGKE